jgi:hypothetical protein
MITFGPKRGWGEEKVAENWVTRNLAISTLP